MRLDLLKNAIYFVPQFYDKHKAALKFGTILVGTGATGYFAYKAGIEEGKNPSKTLEEKAVRLVKPAAAGAITVATAYSTYKDNLAWESAFIAISNLSNEKIKNYEEKLEELVGKDKVNELKTKVFGDIVVPDDIPEGKEYWLHDYRGDKMFRTREEILEAELEVNRMLNDSGRPWITENDVRKKFGLEPAAGGDELKWNCGEYNEYGFTWIEFNHWVISDKNGNTIHCVDYATPPTVSGHWEDDACTVL